MSGGNMAKTKKFTHSTLSSVTQRPQKIQKSTMTKTAHGKPTHTPLQAQASRLLDERQYKSCELIALFDLSRAMQESQNDVSRAITLELLGDCAVGTDRNRQANDYYRDA